MVVVAIVLLYVFVVYTGKHLSFYDYLCMSLWRL